MRPAYKAFGIISPAIYILTVILGGFLRPGYSHLADPVSELTSSGAPNAFLMNILFGLYNLFIIAFGIGVALDGAYRSRKVAACGWALFSVGVLGAVLYFFPQDPMHAPVTAMGIAHIIIAGLSFILMLLTILLFTLEARRREGKHMFCLYSYASFLLLLVSGSGAGLALMQGSDMVGLWERIMAASFLQWLVGFSAYGLSVPGKEEWPQVIQDVGFDFSWDEKKVWGLQEPVTRMPTKDLLWHMDIPFLWEARGTYNLTPREVLEHPELHKKEFERTLRCNLSYPIDIMQQNGRWVILDGLHRLMKARMQGLPTVNVRKIPRTRISEIQK